MNLTLEQGPIRPPSEAYSLLLRLTRNCPWNRCDFCQTYKNEKFSLRTVEEVKEDIDRVREIASEIVALSWKQGFGGEITAPLANLILQHPGDFSKEYRSLILWLYAGGKTVFLQDADSLTLKTEPLLEILGYLKEKFPAVERITTYARAKTISRKTVDELRALHEVGLSRIHIGLESGCDRVLESIQKGVTAREHIDAGWKVKTSGISLSEYVILGLGGRAMWRDHAIETAQVLNQIDPDFIRVRTLKVVKTMPLYQKVERGEFSLSSEDEVVAEERLMIEHLHGIHSAFVSDHILNLLEEVTGKFPDDQSKMIAVIDRYLELPAEERTHFRLGRRVGLYRSLDDLLKPELHNEVDRVMKRIEVEVPGGLESAMAEWMESFI